MASKKLADPVVVHLLEQVVEGLKDLRDGQERLHVDLAGRIDETNARLDDTNARLGDTNARLGRLERAVVGIGRVTALEGRVSRLEERVGIPPER